MAEFKSALAHRMAEYLDFKETLGYKRNSYVHILKEVDRHCAETGYAQEDIVTRKLVYDWLEMRPTETRNGRRKRASVLNGFSKFLRTLGHDSFVLPQGSFGRYQKPQPYIFTDEELSRLFRAIDGDRGGEMERLMPVLMRFYFTTGVRPQEPLSLLREDVDLEKGYASIKDSKWHKDRLVAFSEDLAGILSAYDREVSKRYPDRRFFFSCGGGQVSLAKVRERFKRSFEAAGIDRGDGKRPRIYDWRHNYASRALQMMLDDGEDVDSLLVVLSEHMGHVEFRDTYYYISLLPANLISSGVLEWKGLPGLPYEN